MGSGFRTFTAGEVLTASNVQNYLQDQVVMTFAGSAARSSAIGTANFEEGMVSYLTDTDKVEAYNGTNWVQVGSSNQGLTLINTTSFSGVSSVSLPADTFTSTYTNYKIYLNISAATVGGFLNARLRAAGSDITTGNYNSAVVQAAYATNGLTNDNGGTSQTTWNRFGYLDTSAQVDFAIELMSPKATAFTTFANQNGRSGYGYQTAGGTFNATTAADSITFYPASGNITGVYSVYGANK